MVKTLPLGLPNHHHCCKVAVHGVSDLPPFVNDDVGWLSCIDKRKTRIYGEALLDFHACHPGNPNLLDEVLAEQYFLRYQTCAIKGRARR